MSKILKSFRFLAWVLGLLLSIALITPIVAYFFFEPNNYKTQLSTWITHKTGLPLEIHGDITLSLFPWIGLNVKDVTQGDVIKAQEVGFKMSLETLFRSSITIDSLVLKGVEIYLIKHPNGSTNWETYQKPQQASPQWVDNSRQSQQSTPKKLSFALSNIEIQDAKITYEDRPQKQMTILENIQLTANAQQNHIYPVSGNYSLSLHKNAQQLIARGQGHFKGEAIFAKNAPFANFHTSLSLDLPTQPTSWQRAKLAADIEANTKKITVKDLDLQAGTTRLNGQLTIPLDPTLPIKFALNLNQLNVDKLQSTTPAEKITTPAPKKSSIPSLEQEVLPNKTNKVARLMEGDLTIQELIIKHLKLTQVKTSLKMEGNRLQSNPLTANLYGGRLNLKASKELAQNTPASFQGTVTQIQLQPLLRDLQQPEKITGTTNLDFNLTHGPQGFNGTLKFLVKQGTLTGIDIRYYLYLAKSIFKKEQNTTPDSKSTVFGDLTGTLYINNNVIDNNDLLLQASDLKANGDGSIDLNTQTLAYKMKAVRIKNGEDNNDYPLAIRIKGPLQHPKVEPDLDVYLKAAVKKDLKNAVNKQIERQLGKYLDKNPQEAEQSGQDKLQEKIDKEISKGLKKLFNLKEPDDS